LNRSRAIVALAKDVDVNRRILRAATKYPPINIHELFRQGRARAVKGMVLLASRSLLLSLLLGHANGHSLHLELPLPGCSP
jgi:hypothetical protein